MSKAEIHFNQAKFILSAAKIHQLPPDIGAEVAFMGRSNAGKSSALNALTNQRHLAKTSKTPGRTQLLNVFELNKNNRLIDLPGYGFATVPLEVKKAWAILLDQYLYKRECLKGIVLVMDARHPLQSLDWQFLYWTESCNLDTHIILTKSDKLKFNQKNTVLLNTMKEIKEIRRLSNNITVQLFSALEKTGVKELQKKLLEWYI